MCKYGIEYVDDPGSVKKIFSTTKTNDKFKIKSQISVCSDQLSMAGRGCIDFFPDSVYDGRAERELISKG